MLILCFIITLVSCQKDKTDLTTPTVLKEKFESLPDNFSGIPHKEGDVIIFNFQEGGYIGQITNSDSTGRWMGSETLKLMFNKEILINKTWFSVTVRYLNDIVMVTEASPGVPHYSYLFNKGIRINDKVQPENNIPAINQIKLEGDYLYLMYNDRRNGYYTPEIPAMYGKYNLISGDLILEGPRLK